MTLNTSCSIYSPLHVDSCILLFGQVTKLEGTNEGGINTLFETTIIEETGEVTLDVNTNFSHTGSSEKHEECVRKVEATLVHI